MELTYDEVMNILDKKNFPSERTRYTLQPGTYETSDINKTLENLLFDIVKVSITPDDIRLRSILKIDQTLIFTEKKLFYTISGFTHPHLGLLGDIDGFIRLLPVHMKAKTRSK